MSLCQEKNSGPQNEPMNAYLKEKQEEREEEACDELCERLLFRSFQEGVPLDAWEEGNCDGDDAKEWVWFSPARVRVAFEGGEVFVKPMLIQQGGEVWRWHDDLTVSRDCGHIIGDECLLWAVDVLPAEKVFCGEVIEGGKNGEEEAGEELLDA